MHFSSPMTLLVHWSERGRKVNVCQKCTNPNLSHCAAVGFRLFQGLFHLLNRNYGGIIIYGIYLFEVTETLFNLFDTLEPFQGCLAHVISVDIKDRF